VVLNTQAAPLNDARVRRAFADVIDRARLVRGLVQDQGTLLNAIPPAPGKAFAGFGNLARARSTLTSAGWTGSDVRQKSGDKLMFTIAISDADGLGGVLARAIQYQAARAGFDVEALVLPEDRLFSEWLPGSRFNAAILSWRDPPEGAARAHFSSTPRGAPNIARLSDGDLDDAFTAEDASTSSSQTGSESALARLVPVIPMSLLTVTIVTAPSLKGVRSSAEADGPFWDAQHWGIA
jgi:ABC-type transport system substrate-binding protein